MSRRRESRGPLPVWWRFVLWLGIRGDDAEFFLGDLEETFRRRSHEGGERGARRWLRRQAPRALLAWWRRDASIAGVAPGTTSPSPPRRGPSLVEMVVADARQALRAWAGRPAFTLVVIATLALGIGANAAIYSFFDAILVRDLAYPDADRLVFINAADDRTGERYAGFSYAEMEALSDRATRFSAISGLAFSMRTMRLGEGEPENVYFARVGRRFLDVVGTEPLIGRGFSAEEYRSDSPVAMLTYGFWAGAFGADESVLGESIILDDRAYTIIGVMPPEFVVPLAADARLLAPFPEVLRTDEDRQVGVIGRLAPGASSTQAEAEVAGLVAAMARGPAARPGDEGRRGWIEPVHHALVDSVRRPLWLVLASALAVLLVACVNVSSLLLARGEARRHEFAMRRSLGAGRGRLFAQLLTETLMLSLVGGALGVVLAGWTLPGLTALLPPDTPRLAEVALNGRIVIAMFLASVLATGVAGVLPAFVASGGDPAIALAAGTRTMTSSRRARRLQGVLVVTEMVLTTVLVFAAVLFTSTFANLTRFDRGFDTEGVLVVPLRAPDDVLQARAAIGDFFVDLRDRLAAIPGVEAASLTYHAADRRGLGLRIVAPQGLAETNDRSASIKSVDPAYFRTAGIRLLEGRAFTASDNRIDAPAVVIVNESFARLYVHEGAVVGRRFQSRSLASRGQVEVEIVGVVGDIRPDPRQPPLPVLYIPYAQAVMPSTEVVLRYEGDLEPIVDAVRERVWAVSADIPLTDIHTIEQSLGESLSQQRFHMEIIGLFAALAMLVAAVGVYGTLSFAVSARAHEIGVRQALGARGVDVVRMFVQHALVLALSGVLVGLALSLAMARLVATMLFGVAAVDPRVHLAVTTAIVLLALLAALWPARRAAEVSPVEIMQSR